jgi:hypothetical protein
LDGRCRAGAGEEVRRGARDVRFGTALEALLRELHGSLRDAVPRIGRQVRQDLVAELVIPDRGGRIGSREPAIALETVLLGPRGLLPELVEQRLTPLPDLGLTAGSRRVARGSRLTSETSAAPRSDPKRALSRSRVSCSAGPNMAFEPT